MLMSPYTCMHLHIAHSVLRDATYSILYTEDTDHTGQYQLVHTDTNPRQPAGTTTQGTYTC